MSTTTVTKPVPANCQVRVAISDDERNKMRSIDQMLTGFRKEMSDPNVGEIEKMLIQARAMNALEQAISPKMMEDVMNLMNSPLGFKTDKVPPRDKPYGVDVVKRCLIVAWMMGARAIGNEFNIIAGNCYLTKEFTYPSIMRFPGLTNFEEYIGVPQQHDDKTAICDAYATWYLNGEQHELRCTKSPQMDHRIVVKCYSSSSPDEIRGKVQAKLYQRVLKRLTGINFTDADDAVVDGSVRTAPQKPQAIEHEHVESTESDNSAATKIAMDAVEDFISHASVNEINMYVSDRIKLIESAEWSRELKDDTIERIRSAASGRIAEIRAARTH